MKKKYRLKKSAITVLVIFIFLIALLICLSLFKTKSYSVEYNVKEIVNEIKKLAKEGVQVVTFPELSLTGYTCGDLFNQDLPF